MKKLPALLMVMALLAMNFASTAHAACDQPGGCGDFEMAASVDDHGNKGGEKQNAMCDCCATCGHHHNTEREGADTHEDDVGEPFS